MITCKSLFHDEDGFGLCGTYRNTKQNLKRGLSQAAETLLI